MSIKVEIPKEKIVELNHYEFHKYILEELKKAGVPVIAGPTGMFVGTNRGHIITETDFLTGNLLIYWTEDENQSELDFNGAQSPGTKNLS